MDPIGDDRVLVCNPRSGDETHVERVTALAHDHGVAVRTTEQAGDGKRFAREAAESGAGLIVAAGGDGTLNEVINGTVAAGALGETTVAVVPAGTGNNTAGNLGVTGVEHSFELIETGERRDIDLGVANGRAFVNSCVGGVTAEASAETTPDGKRRFGVLAYVLQTIETVTEFDPLPVAVNLDGEPWWTGEALFVLVGNCRRFSGARRAQANVEDGRFEVTIVEAEPAIDLVGEAALESVFGRESSHIVRRRTSELTIESRANDSIPYSLDGEMLTAEALELETRPRELSVVVGDAYDPDGE